MTLLLNQNYDESKDDVAVIIDWWKWLDNNRGVRASLRRATTVDEVLLQQGFHQFIHHSFLENLGEGKGRRQVQLRDDWKDKNNWLAAALVCGLVAKVKEQSNETIKNQVTKDYDVEQKELLATFIQLLGKPASSGNRPRLSHTRFANLQRSRNENEFFTNMSRAIDVLGKKVPIGSLAENILLWYKDFYYGPDSNPTKRMSVLWGGDYFTTLELYKLTDKKDK